MRSFIAAAFAVGALAATSPLAKRDCPDVCMTYDEATVVAANWAGLIANYSDASANAKLTSDFSDYADSVTTLINSGCPNGTLPLGIPTFTTLAQFEAGQGSQPPIPFQILNLWYSCQGPVVIRWRTALTPEFVTGNIVMETERNNDTTSSEPWLIKTVYSEFNSGAWLVDLGVFKPTCPSAYAVNVTAPAKRSFNKRALPAHLS